jgi:cytidine deaminase
MKKKLSTEFEIFASLDECSANVKALMKHAKKHLNHSFFLVANGKIINGTNQESSSYPVGICAEANALYYSGNLFPNESVKMMAITANSATKEINFPIPPCGSCRQVICDFENRQKKPIKIYLQGKEGEVWAFKSIDFLLPFSFDGSFLE